MKTKIWIFIIVGIIGIAFFSVNVYLTSGGKIPEHFANDAFAETTASTSSSEERYIQLPIRIRIPSIGVDADILPVGVTSLGVMDIPKDPESTVWFELGPRPGEVGSAVIAGHSGWKDGTAAVFDKLSEIQKGDAFSVEDASGALHTFVVRELRSYEKDADASDIFSAEAGKTQLVLITCGGDWDKQQQSYSRRLVVFLDAK